MRRRAGFTLVEILLALGLFALLAAFVFAIVQAVLGLWQEGERRGQGELVFSAATERLRADLLALHTGPRGWLLLDAWEAAPAAGARPAWRLPRLRFLATGAALPQDDPEGASAVEVAWLIVPDAPDESRLGRLVRVTRLEEEPGSLKDEGVLAAMLASGAALVLLDGVAHAGFEAVDAAGQARRDLLVPAGAQADFPEWIALDLERVSGRRRHRLDASLGAAGAAMRVRGPQPPRSARYLLVGREWVEAAGDYPDLSLPGRGLRDTEAAEHPAGAPVLFPEATHARFRLLGGGRRARP